MRHISSELVSFGRMNPESGRSPSATSTLYCCKSILLRCSYSSSTPVQKLLPKKSMAIISINIMKWMPLRLNTADFQSLERALNPP